MRQLQVQVRRERVERVLDLADEHGASSPIVVPGERSGEAGWRVVLLHLPNDRVGAFMKAIEASEGAQAVLLPQGVLPIRPPLETLAERTKDVAPRSTLELVLSALQSIGSWKGMLLYAVFSGLIAAYAVIFNVIYLLIAAMLIAPMGAPAMVCVIGTAVGDWVMVRRGATRFFASIVVLVVSAVALGYAYDLSIVSSTMTDIASVSNWVVLLALVGGAAGAQSLVQSERDSLVSGTAAGFLVAVSLSPTSAVLGLAFVVDRWDYAAVMAFVVLLTFAGIIAGGWMLLRFYGVQPEDPGTGRGSASALAMLVSGVALAVVGLVVWQTQQPLPFQAADAAYEAVTVSRAAGQAVDGARLVDVSARFVPVDEAGVEHLLVSVVVARADTSARAAAVEAAVREAIRARLQVHMPAVRPYVQVAVLPP